eukprot:TRINITY_DN15085_c0_g1_i1.p2 TRINITY_DN15085_c0_g1~~TRINITY_DN15085_c0_g1_i1.p2  ORF type:complete len:109 (+),score=32.00 TRINITY_DN15085_c0_g1_i1:66-392(+)
MVFFFFKQKTAYEMQRGLVGSEMCIRDRYIIKIFFGKCRIHRYTYLSFVKCFRFRKIPFIIPKVFFVIRHSMQRYITVSYTHLTLPTILLVQISVVAVSLKKKKKITI